MLLPRGLLYTPATRDSHGSIGVEAMEEHSGATILLTPYTDKTASGTTWCQSRDDLIW